jgi:hypothetical protein
MARTTIAWKVYGEDGHRQRESFFPSEYYDFSENGETRIIETINADRTGTNEYSIVKITCDSVEECWEEFEGQLTDGIFENSRHGKVELIPLKDTIKGIKRRNKNEEA